VRTLKEIESIYEGLKDWENAYATRQKIARLEKGTHEHILAHHLVEAGKLFRKKMMPTRQSHFSPKPFPFKRMC
jgi:lipopolysaccharide biosynthesis regulator YciM